MAAPKWAPPPDPDLEALARTAWREWELDQPKVLAFDTETTGLEFHDTAFGASVAWVHDDVLTGRKEVRGHWLEFERGDCREAVRRMFAHADVLIAHNAKFDLHKLEKEGIFLRDDQVLHDTEAMSHLDDEHRPKGLKELAIAVLKYDDTIEVPGKQKNKETGKQEDVIRLKARSTVEMGKAKEWAKKHHGIDSVKDVGYHLLPRGVLVPYAVLDAVWTLELARELHPRVLAYPDMAALYAHEMELTRTAVMAMERAGMGTRSDYVAGKIVEYRKRVIQQELGMEQIVGRPVRSGKIPPKERDQWFNPSSSSPDVGLYLAERGHERESYDAENLRTIQHPLAVALLTYRKDKKILDGYFVALQKATSSDGIFHMSLRQHATVSGRTGAGKERGD